MLPEHSDPPVCRGSWSVIEAIYIEKLVFGQLHLAAQRYLVGLRILVAVRFRMRRSLLNAWSRWLCRSSAEGRSDMAHQMQKAEVSFKSDLVQIGC